MHIVQEIRNESEAVFSAFYSLTDRVSEYAPFSEKQKEILLCAIFAAHGPSALRGLGHHVIRAAELGATRQEILGSILLILPVVGISITTQAIDTATAAVRTWEQQTRRP